MESLQDAATEFEYENLEKDFSRAKQKGTDLLFEIQDESRFLYEEALDIEGALGLEDGDYTSRRDVYERRVRVNESLGLPSYDSVPEEAVEILDL